MIASISARSPPTAGPLRSGLIKKGMVYSPQHGDTAFAVPMFDDFMKRSMPEWLANTTPEPARTTRTKTKGSGRVKTKRTL